MLLTRVGSKQVNETALKNHFDLPYDDLTFDNFAGRDIDLEEVLYSAKS